MIRSSWWFFWVVQFVELILTLGSSKDAKEVIFPEMGELSNPVCEHVNFCFTLRFRLASHSDRNHLGGLGIETKMIRPKQTFGFLAFIIRDFLFTLKGKSSWFIGVEICHLIWKLPYLYWFALGDFWEPQKIRENRCESNFSCFFSIVDMCNSILKNFNCSLYVTVKANMTSNFCICFNKFTISHVKSRA